jgi:hypothetical protein
MAAESTLRFQFTSDELKELAAYLTHPDLLLDAEGLDFYFGISWATAEKLFQEGKIQKHPLKDHPKVVRFSYREISQTFAALRKPIKKA